MRKERAAVRDYAEAIRLDPNNAVAYFGRGAAYYDHRKFDDAIRDYTEVIRLSPNNSTAYFLRGNVYTKRGELDKATANRLKAGGDYWRAFVADFIRGTSSACCN